MGCAAPVIELNNVAVRYGSFAAVDHLTLDLHRGELFGLIGPNGAGKTTTIRVLIGQRLPDEGRVTILGHDLRRDWAAIKPHFGYVPDRENHFEEFTGRQNLEFFAGLYRVPTGRVLECLELVELAEAADVLVRGYSLGMRRKLLLARALLHWPRLLYLDEPTANLDIHSAALVRRLLRRHVAEGGTVLLTTHNMEEVEEVCDRVAILSRGRLVALDSPRRLRQQHPEHRVDVSLRDGSRVILDLDQPQGRELLTQHLAANDVAALHTHEFNLLHTAGKAKPAGCDPQA
jgi:ABC-type multidrug transport system ATPase subunit